MFCVSAEKICYRQSLLRRLYRMSFYHSQKEENDIRQILRIVEPISQQYITSVGILQQLRIKKSVVSLKLQYSIPGYPYATDIMQKVELALKALDWVDEVHIDVLDPWSDIKPQVSSTGLANIKHVVAVSSCKGGVGKSTVALNLALSLLQRNLKVGLLDSDVYGPSLPSMISVNDRAVRRSTKHEKFVLPLEGPLGLKVMSFGYVNPKAGVKGAGGKEAALMRGPIASRVTNQLATMTEWGDLDYLIVDMPPGTGDVPITLCQTLTFSGAVVVTTPHTLSLIDAAKGIDMFQDLHVPILAVVENMAYFKADDGMVYYPFGKGGSEVITKKLFRLASDQSSYIPYHSFPISPILSQASNNEHNSKVGDEANLGIFQHPESDIAIEYNSLTDSVIASIFRVNVLAQQIPSISFDAGRGIILRYYSSQKAEEYILRPSNLRARSPVTGELISDESKYSDIIPIRFEMKGNYGVAIHWNDGHLADIFPYGTLKQIAEDNNQPKA